MARYYSNKKSQELEDIKKKEKEKSEVAEIIRKNLETQKIPTNIKKLYEFLNFYAKQSFLEPGIEKDYFKDFWCTTFWALTYKAFPDVKLDRMHRMRPINAVNYIFRIKSIPYRIVWMNKMYSTRMYFYVYKVGKFT